MIDRDDSQGSLGDEIQRRYDLASSREQKLLVLSDYMGPGMAIDALGFIEGDHRGDVRNLADRGQPWGEQADPTKPAISPVGGVMIAGVYHAEGDNLSPDILAQASPAALAKIHALTPSDRSRSNPVRPKAHQPSRSASDDDPCLDSDRRRQSGRSTQRWEALSLRHLQRALELQAGDQVEVTSNFPAKVMILDPVNFSKYRLGSSYRYYEGHAGQTPVRLPTPRPGKWYVVVKPPRYLGTMKASVRVLRDRGTVR